MDRIRTEDVAAVERMIAAEDLEALRGFLDPLHSADIADILQELEPEQQVAVLKRLDNERAAEVLTEIDRHSGQALLLLLSDREVVSLLEEMPSDDAADIMSVLPPEKSERVEALLPAEERQQLHELMEFEEDTAGGIMEIERIAVWENATIRDAIDLARAGADEIENLQKIYVVRDNGELAGYIDILDLLLYPRSTPIGDTMKKNPVVVPVEMDQEDVAALFGKYDEFTLPVVDASNKLVGRITVDDIIDVIEEEASEDITHIAGTTEDELGEPSPIKVSRTRLPWLITGLVGQVFAALIMSRHEVSLQTYVVLAFFVPLIVGTAGSVGIQAAVVVVRELSLGQLKVRHMGRRVLKEMVVASINGVILGAVLFIIVMVWRQEVALASLLLCSLLSVILVAAFIGASVPLVLEKWNIDPAIAAGPFITVSNDIIGLVIYLSMANLYLSRFH
ncbi:MAG: magnesium transporter [Candidatus Krumholzibacteria bacterium]|nr:magnesium transporter [Candidatus Krumholzibacteria bacterium]